MLARVSSGASGIGDYLESGRKRGREFDRDLIDERITLMGSLSLTEMVIDGIDTSQDGAAKYLHITLGFAENFTIARHCADDEVNIEKIQRVTEAYRDMLMAAYDPSEYEFFAEAHIPKVTHAINESTGEYVKRLPHVHIVIPMRNLADGKYLNPLGYGRHHLDHHDAIQEKINIDFKLRSPDAAVRDRAKAVHPLARHNAEFQEQSPKQVKAALQAMIAAGEVQSFDELAKAAEAFGEVKIRQGKSGDYINVTPSWADKGINFKEVTRQDFHAGTKAIKLTTPPLVDFDAIVRHWQARAAFEARYITSGNRDLYKSLDEAGKADLLHRKQQETHTQLNPEPEPIYERPDYDNINPEQCARLRRAANLYQSNCSKARPRQTARSVAGLRNLSSLPVVFQRGGSAMLLQPNAFDRLGEADSPGPKMRWARIGDSRNAGKKLNKFRERTLSVPATLLKLDAPKGIDPDKLKFETSPSLVLADAVRRFGIQVQDYSIAHAKDGTPRIRHGNTHYNLGDFYTKHIGISWTEALPILSTCYYATLSDGIPPPDKELWKSFSAWRDRDNLQAREKHESTRAGLREQITNARDDYKLLKIKARRYNAVERQPILSEGRAKQLVKIEEIKMCLKDAAEEAKRPSRNAQYRAFLNELASAGNFKALGELRRMAPPEAEMNNTDTISGAQSKTVLPMPSYKIDRNGKVTYFKDEIAVVTDSVKGVSVIDAQANAYDIALKVAVARYGRDLTLNGDQKFIQNMIVAARKSGMDLIVRNADKLTAPPTVIQKPAKGFSR